ncbi:MAG TPA: hypothetical protein VGN88_05225 [Phycisphaerae bacterium]|jgi:hypothetical protein
MKNLDVSLPQLGLIAGTRGMLGADVGLLIADRLPKEQRRAVGWTLVAIGALTTIPLLAQLIMSPQKDSARRELKEPEGGNI